MSKPILKEPYMVRCFVDDYEASRWLNDMAEQGYVIHTLMTNIIENSRDRRRKDVQMTILMRLDVPALRPPEVPHSPAPCADVAMSPLAPITLRDLQFDDAGGP